jgi:digeranylgeranylglycerophospholipid reductase
VGLGVQASRLKGKKPIEYLRDFVDAQFPGAHVLETTSGGLPIGGIPDRLSTAGLVLAGDAARLVNPLTGAGIANAMHSGKTAGLIARDAIKAGDLSAAYLLKYDLAMKKTTDWLKGLYRVYAEMATYDDRQMGQAFSCMLRAMGGGKFYFLLGMLAYYNPSLLKFSRSFG